MAQGTAENPPSAEPPPGQPTLTGRLLLLLDQPRKTAAVCLVLSALLLLPLLGRVGLWDPQELRHVDVARDIASAPRMVMPERHARPPLPLMLVAVGLKALGTSELAVRLPVALASLLTLGALFLCGAWLAGRRAAALSLLVLLTVPVFFLGARQVTVHILPMLGQILSVFGLCALCWPRPPGEALRGERALALLAAVGGLAIGFFSTGAALGLAAPLLTVAAALSLCDGEEDLAPACALLAGLGSLALLPPLRLLLTQAQPPGALRVLGGAGLAALGGLWLALGWRRRSGSFPGAALLVLGLGLCFPLPERASGYSSWVGGFVRWPSNREIQVDSVLKPLGFQLFPWSGLLPIALAALVGGAAAGEGRRRFARLVPLAWFATSYVLCTYQGALSAEPPFPALGALALAAGMYLDGLLSEEPGGGGRMAGLCVGLLVVLVGRDLFFFPEQYASAHFTDVLKWPAPLTWLSPVLVNYSVLFGGVLGIGVALSGRWRRRLVLGSLGLALLGAALTLHGLIPALSRHVSYRGIYTKYKSLGGGELGVYAVARSGSKFYDQNSIDLHSVQAIFDFLNKDPKKRAFVLAGSQELAAIDQFAKQHAITYYVADDSNVQFLLLSNQLSQGEQDLNPLKRLVVSTEPHPKRVLRARFEDKIELLGYDLPDELVRGEDFTARLYYKVLKPVGGDYKVFLHIEGGGTRINGDHTPLDGKFPTLYWVPGYYIIDEHRMSTSRIGQPVGMYQILAGFWPGGNAARLKVTEGPQDGDNRVKLGAVKVK